MKNNVVQDERVLSERRKLQSRAYSLIVYILCIAIVVQQFFLRAPFAQYAVEFFLLIGCGFYNIVGNYIAGIDIWNPKGDGKIKMLLQTALMSAVAVITLVWLSGNADVKFNAIYFIALLVVGYVCKLIMISVTNRKQRRMDKELENEDD